MLGVGITDKLGHSWQIGKLRSGGDDPRSSDYGRADLLCVRESRGEAETIRMKGNICSTNG